MGNLDLDRLHAALAAIPSGIARDPWVRVAMALHAEGLPFELFHEWSQRGGNYKGERDCATVWRGLKANGGVGIGTVFRMAKEHGWVPPAPARPLSVVRTPAVGTPDGQVEECPPPGPTQTPSPGPLCEVGVTAIASTGPAAVKLVPMPKAHPQTGVPSARWAYRAADGRLLFYMCRFEVEGGGKRYSPLVFDGQRWRWHGVPAPRPLYGLDRLAKLPHALVVVCEGEKSADAAAELLPDCVCITSSNGACSASKSDWMPLAGRRLVLWPDVGPAGAQYAASVGALAAQAGATVLGQVNLKVLLPGLVPVDGWDAANALAERLGPWTGSALPLARIDATAPDALRDESAVLSENYLALAFEGKYANRLLYCHVENAWYQWAGSHWERDIRCRALALARVVCAEVAKSQPRFQKVSVGRAVEAYASTSETFSRVPDDFNADPWLLATPEGTLDLHTGTVRPADPADCISRVTTVSPAASAQSAERWLQFIEEVTDGDAGLARFLRQMCGYMLTGCTHEQALFFIHGAGGNGKSLFQTIISHLLGTYATHASMETFTVSRGDRHPTDLAMLNNARLVTASETEQGGVWAESRIKQVTGGEKITARFMHRDYFTYTPQFKLLICGNHRPRLRNVDDATRRRMNIIPFKTRPALPDKHLEETLLAEAPGILRWCLDGVADWATNGLVRPSVVRNATDTYFEDEDLVGQWIMEACECGPQFRDSRGILFASFEAYAKAAGERPGIAGALYEALRKRGFSERRNDATRTFIGIKVKPHGLFATADPAPDG